MFCDPLPSASPPYFSQYADAGNHPEGTIGMPDDMQLPAMRIPGVARTLNACLRSKLSMKAVKAALIPTEDPEILAARMAPGGRFFTRILIKVRQR